jgi:hypothetical protein
LAALARTAQPRDGIRLGLPGATLALVPRPADEDLPGSLLAAAALLLAAAAAGGLIVGYAGRRIA